jgi:hypothetical protein
LYQPELSDESDGVCYKSPRAVPKIPELKFPEYLLDVIVGVVKPEKQGIYRADRSSSHALYVLRDAFLFEYAHGSNVGNTFHSTAFEYQVPEWVPWHISPPSRFCFLAFPGHEKTHKLIDHLDCELIQAGCVRYEKGKSRALPVYLG